MAILPGNLEYELLSIIKVKNLDFKTFCKKFKF